MGREGGSEGGGAPAFPPPASTSLLSPLPKGKVLCSGGAGGCVRVRSRSSVARCRETIDIVDWMSTIIRHDDRM